MCNCKLSEVEVVQHCPRKGMVRKLLQYVKSLKYQPYCTSVFTVENDGSHVWSTMQIKLTYDFSLNQSSTFGNEDAL